jgi:hypothetical protein
MSSTVQPSADVTTADPENCLILNHRLTDEECADDRLQFVTKIGRFYKYIQLPPPVVNQKERSTKPTVSIPAKASTAKKDVDDDDKVIEKAKAMLAAAEASKKRKAMKRASAPYYNEIEEALTAVLKKRKVKTLRTNAFEEGIDAKSLKKKEVVSAIVAKAMKRYASKC